MDLSYRRRSLTNRGADALNCPNITDREHIGDFRFQRKGASWTVFSFMPGP